MKKFTTLFWSSIFALTLNSCGNSNTITNQSDITLNGDKMEFYRKDEYSNIKSIVFSYKATAANSSNNTYKHVVVSLMVNFHLTNGQVLSDQSIHQTKYVNWAMPSNYAIEVFEPGQEDKNLNIESNSIGDEVMNYPIDKVTVDFTVDAIDEVNNSTKNNELIKTLDVTDLWKKVLNKSIRIQDKNAEIDSSNAAIERREKAREKSQN